MRDNDLDHRYDSGNDPHPHDRGNPRPVDSRPMTLAELTPAPSLRGRLRSGADSWGSFRIGYARHWVQYRLVVYPPGITDDQRTRLRVCYAAAIWAPVLWLLLWPLASVCGLQPPVAMGVALALTAVAVAAAMRAANPTRRRVRSWIVWVDDDEDPASIRRVDQLLRVVDRLRIADRDLAAGRIDAVQHELIWTRCHNELSHPEVVRTSGRR